MRKSIISEQVFLRGIVLTLVAALLATLSLLGFTPAGVQDASAQPAGCPSGLPTGTTGPCSPNPPLPPVCGLNFAVVFDLSASISASQLAQMKMAANSVVAALTGTGSGIGVYTFGTWAPAYNGAGSGVPAVNGPFNASPGNVVTSEAAAAVQRHINAIQFPSTTTAQFTNWQQGLLQIQPSVTGVTYNAVLFITDGVPTATGGPLTGTAVSTSSDPTGPVSATFLTPAIAAANTLKSETTRVISVGVTGAGLSVPPLEAISGPTEGSDWFLTSYANLGATLRAAATKSCVGTLTVVKQVQALDGTRSPGVGWTFTASASPGVVSSPSGGVTDSEGSTHFAVDFAGAHTSTVTVSEREMVGYQLLTQDGKNAVCTDDGAPASGFANGPGPPGSLFSLPITTTDVYSCLVVNQQLGGSLTLVKKVTNISANAQPDEWTLAATGPTAIRGASGTSAVTSASVLPGTYTLSESGGPPGPPDTPNYLGSAWVCTGSGFTQPSGSSVVVAVHGVAICTITNTEVPVVKLVQDKTVSDSSAVRGQTITYTMTVENIGTAPSGALTATDKLPTGVAFVSSAIAGTTTPGTYDPTTGLWTIPAPGLAPGQTATLTIVATVTANPAPGTSATITNAFEVTAPPGAEETVVNNPCTNNAAQSCAQTVVEGPAIKASLVQSKTVDLTTAAAGDTLTYTVTVANDGNVSATDVIATDTLPTHVSFVSATASTGTFDAATGQWTIPSLDPGTSATLTIEVIVDPSAEATTLVNRFKVMPPTGFTPTDITVENPCTDTPAESCAETVILGVPRLTQSKTVDMGTAVAGDQLTYTLTVANVGTAAADDVAAQDILPPNVTFVHATPTQGTYDSTTGVWDIGTIAPGETVTLIVVATVDGAAEGTTLVNRFQVDTPSGGEVITVENPCTDDPAQSCAETVVPGVPRLTQNKVVDQFEAAAGSTLTYTMTIDNPVPPSSAAAENVTATDSLPAGVTLVSASPSQGTYDPASGVWNIGTIPLGATATLTLVVTIDPDIEATSLTNAFVVEQPLTGPPPEVDNPCVDNPVASCAVTEVPGVPQLLQGKTVDMQTAAVGGTLTYTITVANTGTADASPVVATDTLPPGVTFVSATPSQGTYDPTTGTWTISTLAVGMTSTLTLVVTIDPVAAGHILTNRLGVSAPPGSAETTVNDPCPTDPTLSCASTVVAAAASTAPPPSQEAMHPSEIITDLGSTDGTAHAISSIPSLAMALGGATLALVGAVGVTVAFRRLRRSR